MSGAQDLVNKAADDARSCGDMASEVGIMPMSMEPAMESPLDHETLDEQTTMNMGARFERIRRDDN